MTAELVPPTLAASTPHGGAYRAPAIGTRGVVASANGLASLAGLRVLMEGGNAADAAVAVGAMLNVVEPFMSGIGGVGGNLVFYEARADRIHALSFIGQTPRAADPAMFPSQEAVADDPRSPAAPAMLAGWLAALDRFGTADRATVLRPAIEQAEVGWPVTPLGALELVEQERRLSRFPSSRRVFYPRGRPPRAGEVVPNPELARSFREVVEGGAAAFYGGPLGERLVRGVQEAGGILTIEDLREVSVAWVEPIAVEYRGYRIDTMPPECNGVQILESLKILEAYDLPALGHNTAEYLHLLIETVKIASADRTRWAHDPLVRPEMLLDDRFIADRRRLVDRSRAQPSEGERYLAEKPGMIEPGDPFRYKRDNTTHFDVVDRWGNIASITQTNGGAWGCGMVAGDTGITLNNHLYWRDLDPASPSRLRPGTRGQNSMAPCIVSKEGRPILGIGTPGSYGILQTTLQMLVNVLDFGINVQAAIEAPRFRAFERTIVDVEGRIPVAVRAGLERLGHQINVLPDFNLRVGGGHGVAVDADTGTLSGGADPRRDGVALAF
ncbi:MAG: gamma-glutamyltransferase [Chloroflexi bacterium]|nr:gamma-glutamyltransferase [Chloroflexota bacterium]